MEILSYISSLAEEVAEGKSDFFTTEQKVFQMAKTFGALVMETVIAEADQRLFERKTEPGTSEGFRAHNIQTLFGEIHYRRRLYALSDPATKTNRWHYGLDQKLGLKEKQTISPTLDKMGTFLSTQVSYRKSAAIMRKEMGLSMTHQRIHTSVQEAGKAIRERQEQAIATAAEGERGAEIVVVESDGVYVNLQRQAHQQKKHHEYKVGTIYEGWEPANPAKTQYHLKHPRVFFTEGDRDAYWQLVDHHLLSTYDLEQVGQLVFGSDGAKWAEEGVDMYAGALHQIDQFHVTQWIKRAFGFGEKHLVDTIYALIETDDREGLRHLMNEKKAQMPKKKKEIQQLENSLLAHWESLKDYRGRAEKLPETARGIGNIEHTNDQIIADRMKKRGMSWKVESGANLIYVQSAVINGAYEEIWQWMREQKQQRKAVSEQRPIEQRSPAVPEEAAPKGKRGRPTKDTKRAQTTAWCQTRMPGKEGREAWLREFIRALEDINRIM